jgi:iron complex outermembrane receptor protein
LGKLYRCWRAVALATALTAVLYGTESRAQSASDLAQLSIEQLGNVQVTSVSKRAESIGEAPASIYVITRDEILRSGARSIPEILRLAPNLEVFQASSSRYIVTARGFNGAPAAQNFSNKLLVLIDGRTVYNPLFSGVYWDMQDVPPDDIERIEVISGPGATLWGANAVNGVINIITRNANDTQGAFVTGALGEEERGFGVRYGGRLSDTASYRAYVKSEWLGDTFSASGVSQNDHWTKPQGGIRLDWAPSARDSLTLQGDLYQGAESQLGAEPEAIRGENLTARWTRAFSPQSSLQLQAYYDRVDRSQEVDGTGFYVDTYDVDVQHSFTLGRRQEIVWGGGYRAVHYRIFGTSTLFWAPPSRTLDLVNGFIQDTVTLSSQLKLVLGVKVEDDPYISPVALPSARLSFSPSDQVTLWGAVSRAIRAPTPFDREVQEKAGPVLFLTGNPDFQSEKLTAYELGAKLRPSSKVSLSASAYYNDYDDLRSIEPAPGGFIPLRWGNGMKGQTWGVEAWGDLQATPWWRLSASITYLHEAFGFQPEASGLLGVSQAANDPKVRALLKSSMRLGRRFSLDADLRYYSSLPDGTVPAYTELNGRLAFDLTERLQLGLAGRNLLHDRHLEYTAGNEIPRSVFADLRWRF